MPADEPAPPSRVSWGDLLVALGVLGLGAFFLHGATVIKVLPSYARVGPRFFPFAVAGALLACGVALAIMALSGRRGLPEDSEDADAEAPTDWRVLVVIGAALVLDLFLIEPAGFVLSSTLLFWGVALGCGDRRPLRTIPIGFVLSAGVYLAFTRLLGLTLPAGIRPL